MATKKRGQDGVTRCAIYCRVSSAKQEQDGTSLASQTERCRAYAAERGWDILSETQEVWSGYDRHRPKLEAVRNAIRAGDVDVLLCYALDRLSRNQTDTAILVDECDTAGVALAFVTEDFEQTPVGRFIRNAKSFAAEIEREKLIERTGRGVAQRVKGGARLPGCRALYGYTYEGEKKSRLAVNLDTARVVRRIYTDFLAGGTIRGIAAQLTTEGVATPTGRAVWGATTVHRILSTPEYAGDARAFRHKIEPLKNAKHRTRRTRRGDDEMVALPGTVPALIDPETFATVQAKLDRNRRESPRRSRDPEGALLRAGLAKCAYCGHNLAAVWKNGGYSYRCNRAARGLGCPSFTIRAATLDTFVWEKIARVLTHPDHVMREAMRDEGTTDQSDLTLLERAIRAVDGDLERLRRRYATEDDEGIAAMIRDDLKRLIAQKQAHEADYAATREHIARRQVNRDALDAFLDHVERAYQDVADFTYQQKREALAALGVTAMVRAEGDGPRIDVRARVDLTKLNTDDNLTLDDVRMLRDRQADHRAGKRAGGGEPDPPEIPGLRRVDPATGLAMPAPVGATWGTVSSIVRVAGSARHRPSPS